MLNETPTRKDTPMYTAILGVCLLLVTVGLSYTIFRQQCMINELEGRVETLERR